MVMRRILWREDSLELFSLKLERLRCSGTGCKPGACIMYVGDVGSSAYNGGEYRIIGRFGGFGAGRVRIYGRKSLTMVSLRPSIGETLRRYRENKKASSSILRVSALPKTCLQRSSSTSKSFAIFRTRRALGTENVTYSLLKTSSLKSCGYDITATTLIQCSPSI